MFKQRYVFGDIRQGDHIRVGADDLYSSQKGYGFFTESIKTQSEVYRLPDLNSGFEPEAWYSGMELVKIKEDSESCFTEIDRQVYNEDNERIPLTFKMDLPHQGNYHVTIGINGGLTGCKDLMLFSERRRLLGKDISIAPGETKEFRYTVNVCDFIPRGKKEVYEDRNLDITIIGGNPRISYIDIEEADVPTIYIAGDSTLTDQIASYPYQPETSYGGWAQFISCFFKEGIAISNHAHSGLTTESFRSEGHYDIVQSNIKPGDYYFMQFAHNDQKLDHLKAYEGYHDNIITYINEIREVGAIPVIVSPLCRNTWKGSDGTYNDLLEEYGKACNDIAKEFDVPVIDLHKESYKFITNLGLESAKAYFYPNDYTHSNDFGSYKFASLVADKSARKINSLSEFVKEGSTEWLPPENIVLPSPPEEFTKSNPKDQPDKYVVDKVEFKDIDKSKHKNEIIKLSKLGIIPHEDESYRPEDFITRVEVLQMIIKIANFFPTNVYNDMFTDVVGHEWYAGTIDCAWSNGMIDKNLIEDKKIYPNKAVTYEEFISLCINAYSSRKTLPEYKDGAVTTGANTWSEKYIKMATKLGLHDSDIKLSQRLTRGQAADILNKLRKAIR